MRNVLCCTALLIGAVAGCGTVPSAPGSPVGPMPSTNAGAVAPSQARPRVTLASEQLRLSDLFRGTPVVFAMQSDGGLLVVVPQRHSFDRGSAAVKPPLGAVLDRLASSQLNETSLLRVKTTADAGTTDPTLARGRGVSTRDYLVARGIPATRLSLAGTAKADGVEIVVAEGPSPR